MYLLFIVSSPHNHLVTSATCFGYRIGLYSHHIEVKILNTGLYLESYATKYGSVISSHDKQIEICVCFELWCWRRLLRVPWTARRSNQSILKEISHGCSLEGMMLKLKLQYFGHLMQRVDSLEKTLIWEGLGAGGEGDDRG